jgi:hypothetical protein
MPPEEKFSTFDKLGEAVVRFNVSSGKWGGTEASLARSWLEMRSSAKRDARETKTLFISVAAIIISIIAAHKEIKWLITSLISWLP